MYPFVAGAQRGKVGEVIIFMLGGRQIAENIFRRFSLWHVLVPVLNSGNVIFNNMENISCLSKLPAKVLISQFTYSNLENSLIISFNLENE